MKLITRRFTLLAMTFAVLCGSATAAEFRLREQCRASGPLVTLGDVADVIAADKEEAKRLAAIELFPSSAHDRAKIVRVREIQDILMLRGVNLATHRFSGASRVEIGATDGRSTHGDRVPNSVAKSARRVTVEAIVTYLEDVAANNDAWLVDVELDAKQSRLLAAAGRNIQVSGGVKPWVGKQSFELSVNSSTGQVQCSIDAHVSLSPAVVVVTRALHRGAIIRAGDVQLKHGPDEVNACRSIDDVVGHETIRAIPSGKIVTKDALQMPTLVHRGEIVTVYSRSAGVLVKTTARAREDGSRDELLAVESLAGRKRFFARVSGIREVEVFAQSVRTKPNRPPVTNARMVCTEVGVK